MTRDEAEKAVRSAYRQCRGPRRKALTPLDYQHASDELAAALALVTDEAHGGAAKDADELLSRMLADVELYGVARELDGLLRVGCGADFNDVIVAGPLDGTVQPYTC